MQPFMARPIYTLSTPDGRAVGTIFETQGRKLTLWLDPAFHESARGQGTEARPAARLVIEPIDPARRCG